MESFLKYILLIILTSRNVLAARHLTIKSSQGFISNSDHPYGLGSTYQWLIIGLL